MKKFESKLLEKCIAARFTIIAEDDAPVNVPPPTRVTLQDVEESIVSEHYFTAEQGDQQAQEDLNNGRHVHPKDNPLALVTFCVLVLKNGFTVTGESACVTHENFDAAIGREVARENAVEKIWPLLGYELKQKRYEYNRT